MTVRRSKQELVLTIYPSAKGFGFAVFEGSRSLVDWGVKGSRGGENKNTESLRKIQELLAFYHPDVLTVRSYTRGNLPRSRRILKLIDAIQKVATERKIVSKSFSRDAVRACFTKLGARTKRQIAEAIARQFPELEPRLPPIRRIWMSEDARMSMFDAIALGITFFHTKQKTKRAA